MPISFLGTSALVGASRAAYYHLVMATSGNSGTHFFTNYFQVDFLQKPTQKRAVAGLCESQTGCYIECFQNH
jgi:hypothetical protein